MKEKLTPRWLIITLSGLLFAAYSAYYVFLIFRDKSTLPPEGILISACVALMFFLLAVFAWTSEVKNIEFLEIRRTAFAIIMLVIIALKLRIVGRVISYIDCTNVPSILYGASFLMTIAGFLILSVYYIFIVKNILLYPKAAFFLPLSAMILFLLSFVAEIVMFFAYGFGLEESVLRTVVIRPVFYLSFIGLSAYFLFPPQLSADEVSEMAVSETVVDDTFILESTANEVSATAAAKAEFDNEFILESATYEAGKKAFAETDVDNEFILESATYEAGKKAFSETDVDNEFILESATFEVGKKAFAETDVDNEFILESTAFELGKKAFAETDVDNEFILESTAFEVGKKTFAEAEVDNEFILESTTFETGKKAVSETEFDDGFIL